MSYQRLYPQRINWEDEPSLATPINQVNLNKMDSALYGIDGRVVELDENKVGKTETFNTSRNGVVPKPTQADITNEKVLRADGVWVEQSGGGGGGGGHIYVDKDDEQMPPRGKAKFTGGLNLTDDSENNRTIVDDNYEIIPWTTWQGYSDAEKAQHPNAIITGAPDCDGTLEIENMHLAWENPDPTSAFAGQNVIFDTDDYDGFELWCTVVSGLTFKICGRKNDSRVFGATCGTSPNSYTTTYNRSLTKVSDTEWTINDCYVQNSNGARSIQNSYLIPLYVYTYKDDLIAKIKAIAHNVSTDASKCMLDENTSVEDALSYSTTEHDVGKWIDGKTLYEKTVDCGALPAAGNKTIAHGIINLDSIYEIRGVAIRPNTSWYPLPFTTAGGNAIGVDVNSSSVVIRVGTTDYSNYTESYITFRYTKTS
mgnify:CR=1 FL=1